MDDPLIVIESREAGRDPGLTIEVPVESDAVFVWAAGIEEHPDVERKGQRIVTQSL